MTTTRRVGIVAFDDMEVLDAFGPFEVFSAAGRRSGGVPFDVVLVSERPGPVTACGRLVVQPHHAFADCPALDLLLVPGGPGTRREMHRAAMTGWIAERARSAELVLSVCTGALLLARAGLLDGLLATTHHGALDLLREIAPRARVVDDRRWVDNGRLVLSAGIAAGIDMSLHVVERLAGRATAEETARYMEVSWRPDS